MLSKTVLISFFKTCLNILRLEGLTGEKALRNLSYLLILKLIEPRLGNEIDIDNCIYYDFSHIDNNVNLYKDKLLKLSRFSNLIVIDEFNFMNDLKNLWDDILSYHPSTKLIFQTNKFFDIKSISTFKKLFDKINEVNFTNSEYDILGNAYEEVIQDIMTGKVLGQFFTQPIIKNIMVKLINPQINNDGTILTCADPTMGTGGFLITYIKYLIKQSIDKNINLNWNFIKTNAIYGKEIDPDTYQLALSNLLISTGHIFNNLDCGDSIRVPVNKKFDYILANPPYGINGINYSEINDEIKDKYIPIKCENSIGLFIQAIIYMLKINGKCAVVLPNGKEIFSKTNKTFIQIREYLLKTCEIHEIIYLPDNSFNYTDVNTCIFYFTKKEEGETIIDLSYNKNNIVSYKFKNIHKTEKIKFYNYNIANDSKEFLAEVSIDKVINNKYALNYNEYIDVSNNINSNIIEYKTIGELCNFLPKSKRNAKYGKETGLYPFFKSSLSVDSYVDIADFNKESIIIGDGGEPNINYGIQFSTSDHCYVLQNKDDNLVNLKYIYYYILTNLNLFKNLYTGIAIKNISKTNIINFKIPIPPINLQNNIVQQLDLNNQQIKELEIEINNKKIYANQYINNLLNNNDILINSNQINVNQVNDNITNEDIASVDSLTEQINNINLDSNNNTVKKIKIKKKKN
jgi:type I restriction-modification system DNA methylase subunit